MRPLSGFVLLCAIFLSQQVPQASATSELYPATPYANIDTAISGTVDGKAVQFEYHVTHHPAHQVWLETSRVRLAANSAVSVTVQLPSGASAPSAHGVGRSFPVNVSGQTATFTLPGPGHYYLMANGMNKKILFWIDDLSKARVQPGQANVIDVTTRGISSNLTANQTGALQNLMQTVPDGSTLYFPPGVYRSGTLTLTRSNLKIYLDRGAMLKGLDAYTDFRKGFIELRGVSNVTLSGPGTIDANGMTTWARVQIGPDEEVKIRNVEIQDSSNLVIEDLLLADSNSWTLHFQNSQNVKVSNVKIFGGKDGIDPDSSNNVTIDTIYVQSVDDAIAFKANSEGVPMQNATVTNCMMTSGRATGLKIGTENYALVNAITFELCDVLDTDRGISIHLRKDDAVRNITFRKVRVLSANLALNNKPTDGPNADIHNILYDNVVLVLSRQNLLNEGYKRMNTITMRNIQVHVNPSTGGELFLAEPGSLMKVEGMEVFWRGNKGGWKGLFKGKGFAGQTGIVENDGWGAIREYEPLKPDPSAAPEPTPACALTAAVECAAEGNVATTTYSYTQQPNYALSALRIRINGNPSNQAECQNTATPPVSIGWFCDRSTKKGEDQFLTVALPVMTKSFAVTPDVPYQLQVSGDLAADGRRLSVDQCASQKVDFTCTAPARAQSATRTERLQSLISAFGSSNCNLNKNNDCMIDIFDYSALLEEF